MRRWYVRTGQRVAATASRTLGARMGAAGVDVAVTRPRLPLGLSRPRATPDINIHWATLQLPPSLIDYVIVHELAHLNEPNHTPAYWNLVERAMPGYETHKCNLAVLGKNVWLGAVD